MSNLRAIVRAIGDATGHSFELAACTFAGGGCINTTQVLDGKDDRRFFLKLNDAGKAEMFAAEAEGLEEILGSAAIRAPNPICHGVTDGQAFLVLEHLPLGSRGNAADLGRQLAAMHRHTAISFGWRRDNTIGATHQPNDPGPAWIEFYRDRRLGFQLELAGRKGIGRPVQSKGERLLERLAAFFPGYSPQASLLHGDLWGGNYGYADGEPVLFDPAVYYGDREADLAMTELFGGFPANFYAAYREAWPLDPGYTTRRTLYNLYHVLNHYNLFGGGYGGQAGRMLDELLTAAY